LVKAVNANFTNSNLESSLIISFELMYI